MKKKDSHLKKSSKSKTFNDLEWDQAVDFNLSPGNFEKQSSFLIAEGGDCEHPVSGSSNKGMMGGEGGCGSCDMSMGSGASSGNSNSSSSG